jgi:ESCRT-II complex subunit VPS22
MSVAEVQEQLQRRTTRFGARSTTANTRVSAADICMAVSKLQSLGGGFKTLPVGNSNKQSSMLIVSVPTELNPDHTHVLGLAAAEDSATCKVGGRGSITLTQLRDATGWSEDRCQRALDLLLQEGMAWLDKYQGEFYYWFPSIWKGEQLAQSD